MGIRRKPTRSTHMASCPVHAYELDFTSLRKSSAVFGTEQRNLSARSDGGAAVQTSRTSARSALSEGNTPRGPLLGPDYDSNIRKHAYHASINTSGRKMMRKATCPVHAYSAASSSLQAQHGVPFGRAQKPPALPSGKDGSPVTMLGPDYDKALKPGTYHASFSGVPRKLGAVVDSTPVHSYSTPSPMGKSTYKATFGSEMRFGADHSAPVHMHYTPSPMGKKTFKATFGTASRFGSGPCSRDPAPRPLPLRRRSLPTVKLSDDEQQQQLQQQQQQVVVLTELKSPPKKLAELDLPVAGEKNLEQVMPLSARLSLPAQSPWRHGLPLPDIMPAEESAVACAA